MAQEEKPENLTIHTLCIKSAADYGQQLRGVKASARGEVSKCVDYAQASAKNAGYIPYYIYRQKNTVENLENVGFSLPGTEGLYNIYMMEEIQAFSLSAPAPYQNSFRATETRSSAFSTSNTRLNISKKMRNVWRNATKK